MVDPSGPRPKISWQTWGGQLQLCYLFGYRSLVTPQWHFEKGNLVKIRCRVSLTYVVCMDYVETWGKRPLLACSKSAGGGTKVLQISPKTCRHTQIYSSFRLVGLLFSLCCDGFPPMRCAPSLPQSTAGIWHQASNVPGSMVVLNDFEFEVAWYHNS